MVVAPQSRDKAEFFDRLQALEESSGDEAGDAAGRVGDAQIQSQYVPSSSPLPSKMVQLTRLTTSHQKAPELQRTASAPVTSGPSLSQAHPATLEEPSVPISLAATPQASDNAASVLPGGESSDRRREVERQIVSNPLPCSLVLTNSTGIAAMLGKKRLLEAKDVRRKRKDTKPTLVPECERIFEGLTFYYIPPNDIAPVRRRRIAKAQRYGAEWTRKWTNAITHVVADKSLDYREVMDHLRPHLQPGEPSAHIVTINEDYPLDCITYGSILDSRQIQYVVNGMHRFLDHNKSSSLGGPNPDVSNQKPEAAEELNEPAGEAETLVIAHRVPDLSLEIRSKLNVRTDDTPEQSQLLPRDELDEAIQIAKTQGSLPLDDEGDDFGSPSIEQQLDSSGSENGSTASFGKGRSERKDTRGTFHQENFSCMTGGIGTSSSQNPNARTIEILQKMADHYERTKDEWRVRAYRKTIGILRKQTTKISTYDDAKRLPNVGERLALKIEEIVFTDRLRRLEYAELESGDKFLQLFLKIYGVGVSQASRWISQGHNTLEDLKANVHLTDNQRVGIDHYKDFNARIPREEVTQLGDIVSRAAAMLDPEVRIIIGGSYRRGAATSGDIDCLVTKQGTTSSGSLLPFLDELTIKLTADGFLVAALAVSRFETGSKWHGACVLPRSQQKVWRRIDFLLVPEAELGAALIYFTGDDIFNRSMRLLASYKGLRLNQKGLYQNVMRGPNRVRITQGSLVEGSNEEKIFEALGVPWRPPRQRICH